MYRCMKNALGTLLARPAAALAVLAGLAQAALAEPAAMAATRGSAPGPLPPKTSGYRKHPPLPFPTRPAAVRLPPRTSGYWKHPPAPDPGHVHTAVTAVLAGWQIRLIAVGAAVAAAVIVHLVRRARAARDQSDEWRVTGGGAVALGSCPVSEEGDVLRVRAWPPPRRQREPREKAVGRGS